jgi:hypothetical protein
VARKGPRTEDGRIGIYRKDQFGVLKFLTFGTIFLITLTATPFAAMGGGGGAAGGSHTVTFEVLAHR